ncbi:sigma-70 family RNA polymerase sigma factor [Tetragenococcus koreensis]|uniref:sigma-70 family RNA polymerase sigma factor n=1 Tax=Tetragenococcus koreensis TaxID=290335 RepID=UPI001F3D9B90|nr:sigma-70 family RNA polymerase sigma factor [Tetragenococcus koreensis]MCF1615215.1 sigma-70 family RNA polymerase sigma factor [Tetragenococcus koreensis]MCF1625029.1 sigma-70 family RNA polymerase sigma factor [Tetragenococcus koreensis]
MQTKELDQLVQDYQRLFYKVLRKCSIFPGQPDYEDHMQELRLLFFLKAKPYETRGLFEAENNVSYLYRFLLWSIIDKKRKKDPKDHEVNDEEVLSLQQAETNFNEIELLDEFITVYNHLLAKDQRKVLALLENTELSRQNRHRYRMRLRKLFKENR